MLTTWHWGGRSKKVGVSTISYLEDWKMKATVERVCWTELCHYKSPDPERYLYNKQIWRFTGEFKGIRKGGSVNMYPFQWG